MYMNISVYDIPYHIIFMFKVCLCHLQVFCDSDYGYGFDLDDWWMLDASFFNSLYHSALSYRATWFWFLIARCVSVSQLFGTYFGNIAGNES